MKFIWPKGIPFKISFFMWRVRRKRIPSRKVSVKIKVESEVKCCCNSNHQETFEHLVVQCPDALKLWQMIIGASGIKCIMTRKMNK